MLTCNAHLFTFFHGTALKTWCLHSTVTSHSENGKFRFPPTQIIEIIHWDGPLHWPPWSGETIWRYWEGFLWSQSPGLTLTVLHLRFWWQLTGPMVDGLLSVKMSQLLLEKKSHGLLAGSSGLWLRPNVILTLSIILNAVLPRVIYDKMPVMVLVKYNLTTVTAPVPLENGNSKFLEHCLKFKTIHHWHYKSLCHNGLMTLGGGGCCKAAVSHGVHLVSLGWERCTTLCVLWFVARRAILAEQHTLENIETCGIYQTELPEQAP